MSKTYEQLAKELDSKIPRDVISERDGGGGRKLSYLEGWYVIDRLNKVLGHGNWSYNSYVEKVHEGTIKDRYDNTVHTVHYSARVTLSTVSVSGCETSYTDYGYGDGTDKVNPGKAHELAIKESITDGLKRCAKNLGMSMGLALYDKTKENVEDGETETNSDGRDNQVRDSKERKEERRKPEPTKVVEAKVDEKRSEQSSEEQDAKLPELVLRYIKVAKAQKKSEQTREYFAKLGVTSPDDIVKLDKSILEEAKKFLEELTK